MSHFHLGAGAVSQAVAHRSVEELWYVIDGRGALWRRHDDHEEIVALEPGLCVSIPRGTHFQFRASAREAVSIVAVTMPPWPGEDEALFVAGPWTASPGE